MRERQEAVRRERHAQRLLRVKYFQAKRELEEQVHFQLLHRRFCQGFPSYALSLESVGLGQLLPWLASCFINAPCMASSVYFRVEGAVVGL